MPPEGDVRSMSVTELEIGARARNALRKIGVRTLGELSRVSSEELLASRCVGWLTVEEIIRALAAYGLSLRDSPFLAGGGRHSGRDRETIDPRFVAFAREPWENLHLPVWVLDLCPRTLAWLEQRGILSVRDLVETTADDLWLLARDADLPLDRTVEMLDELFVRFRAFGLSFSPQRLPRLEFCLPSGGPEFLSSYRIDEFCLLAETVFRLEHAGLHTLGDLRGRPGSVTAEVEHWPEEPRLQAHALMAMVDRGGVAVPDPPALSTP